MADLRPAPGTYVLQLMLSQDMRIQVGRLGTLDAAPGRYLYVGSALGPGGVKARVERHARTDKNAHWHIDYLRAGAVLSGVWVAYSDKRLECAWARALADAPSAVIPMAGFGASDCGCPAHLIYRSRAAALDQVRQVLQRVARAPDVHYRSELEPGG